MDTGASGSRDEPGAAVKTIIRKELFLVLRRESFFKLSSIKCTQRLVHYIIGKFFNKEPSNDFQNLIKSIVKVFVSKLLKKWRDSKQIHLRFMNKYGKWLDSSLTLPSHVQTTESQKFPRGRPRKCFMETSRRSKQRSAKNIVSDKTPEELCYAAQFSLIRNGKRTAARVVRLALTTSPRPFKEMKRAHNNTITNVTSDEALAMIVDLGLGKEGHIHIQRGAKSRGVNIYPGYNEIAQSKKRCYPLNIEISETRAKIPLQNLLDLTMKRLH